MAQCWLNGHPAALSLVALYPISLNLSFSSDVFFLLIIVLASTDRVGEKERIKCSMFDGRTKSFEYLEFGIGRRLFLRSLVLMLLPPSSLALVESNGTDSLLFRDDSDGGLDCIRS